MKKRTLQTLQIGLKQIMGLRGIQDGRQWKCSNSAKIWSRNLWYHTKCVSWRLEHKTKIWRIVRKLLIIFHGRGSGGGGTPPWKIPWKYFYNNFSKFCFVVLSPWNTFCMIPQIPSSNFGCVRAFSLAAILKSTKPHDFAHYMRVWGGGRKGGGHNLVSFFIDFFHVSDHFEEF